MLRRWLLLVACLAPAIGAAQQDPLAGRSAFEIVASLPRRLAAMQREGEPFDHERRLPGSGLGASVGYRFEGAGQGRATVYLYGGHVPPRAALDEADMRRQFQVAFREIEALGPRLRYRVLGTVSAAPIAAPGTEPAMPCFRTLLAQESGLRVESFTCLA